MTAAELIKANQAKEALAMLQQEVRSDPADPARRVFLFQLLALHGHWERALQQLDVCASLSEEWGVLSKVFAPLIHSESFRAEVFAGKRLPLLFGEPASWVGPAVQAAQLAAQGQWKAALSLRDQAFEAAPAIPGTIDGRPFAWLADADARLGPLLELHLQGKYYWVPFERIRRMAISPPSDLRDLIWLPAQFVWTNGGEASGHIPTRYPGTEAAPDGRLLLARSTDWQPQPEDQVTGLGQRLFATDAEEIGVLDVRVIDFAAA